MNYEVSANLCGEYFTCLICVQQLYVKVAVVASELMWRHGIQLCTDFIRTRVRVPVLGVNMYRINTHSQSLWRLYMYIYYLSCFPIFWKSHLQNLVFVHNDGSWDDAWWNSLYHCGHLYPKNIKQLFTMIVLESM